MNWIAKWILGRNTKSQRPMLRILYPAAHRVRRVPLRWLDSSACVVPIRRSSKDGALTASSARSLPVLTAETCGSGGA